MYMHSGEMFIEGSAPLTQEEVVRGSKDSSAAGQAVYCLEHRLCGHLGERSLLCR